MADRVPPGVVDLTDLVDIEFTRPVGHGAYADVYKQKFGKTYVAVKVLRKFTQSLVSSHDYEKRIYEELSTWVKLKHENILSLVGVLYWRDDEYPSLVSRWMENGQVNIYLKRNPDADFLFIIRGIARGLAYLHSQSVAHGDIRGDNVLVDAHGRPVIADFGLSKWLNEAPLSGASSNASGCRRYMPIEFYTRENGNLYLDDGPIPARRSRTADVWAYGMTVLELWTGNIPFHDCSEAIAIVKLSQKVLPTVPECPQNTRWAPLAKTIRILLKATWSIHPNQRITMDQADSLLGSVNLNDLAYHLPSSYNPSPMAATHRKSGSNDSSSTTLVASSTTNSLGLVTSGLANMKLSGALVLGEATLTTSPTETVLDVLDERSGKSPSTSLTGEAVNYHLSTRRSSCVNLPPESTPTNGTSLPPAAPISHDRDGASRRATIGPVFPATPDHVHPPPGIALRNVPPQTPSTMPISSRRQRTLSHSSRQSTVEDQVDATPRQRLDVPVSFLSALNEYLDKRRGSSGIYFPCKESGPPHARDWEAELELNGRILGRGKGWTKQAAKEEAAFAAIATLLQSGEASRGLQRILLKKAIECHGALGQIRWNTTYVMARNIPEWTCVITLNGSCVAQGRGPQESLAQEDAAAAAWPRLAQVLSWPA